MAWILSIDIAALAEWNRCIPFQDRYNSRTDNHASPFIYKHKLGNQACVRIHYSIPRDDVISVLSFADLIKKERLERGLKQTELAEILGVNEKTVVNWEVHGRMPRNGQREKLVEFFEVEDSAIPVE